MNNKCVRDTGFCIFNFTFLQQKHARRVYEILRLRATDMSDEEKAKEYCLEVKKRLFGPYRVSFKSLQLQA